MIAPKMQPERVTETIPSLIKWTGSKRAQAKTIATYLPEYNRYFEPFLGSGAVLYGLAKPGDVASDIYQPLIDLWKIVQDDPELIISNYTDQWTKLQENLPEYYYQVRTRFNDSPNAVDLNFLLRTCVNGIVRFSAAGKFNNSFHLSRKGMLPRIFASNVRKWHTRIKGINFYCQDFADTIADAVPGDFIYMDPPYLGSRQRYIQNIDAERFLTALETLNSRGIKWALSFDGRRGDKDLIVPIPDGLYRRHVLIENGNSAVGKVLNGPVEMVEESLYLNY
jgi:DNA adenine methylase